jgi:hypothetical protein
VRDLEPLHDLRNSGNTQGTFKEHSGNIQETFREHLLSSSNGDANAGADKVVDGDPHLEEEQGSSSTASAHRQHGEYRYLNVP